MIFVLNQLTAKPTPGFEQQFAAYNNLTQSLSEEFDRATELQAQNVQIAWESWGEFCSDLSLIKDPQEFFIRSTNQMHAIAAQSQQFLHAVVALNQQIQEKFLALGQTISPMMLNSVVEVIPVAEIKPAQQHAAALKDINSVKASVLPKTTQRKPRAAAVEVTAVKPATITETEISTPTPKARQVKSTKKTEVNPSSEATSEAASTTTTPAKKSAVVGLPSKPAAKSGFASAAGQPDYKAKSSKATGAKKRVRQ
jgi:hypothetical protein